MITFKQFLHEEDETDKLHDSVQDAARDYVEHCRQFPDVDHPLYRLSGSSWSSGVKHDLKTRVPRTRQSASLGGSAAGQEYLFSQPSWDGYPKRRQSIFCSTTKDFEIDDPSDDGANLLMIYPYDGVKIAVLPENDLNMMNILRGTSYKRHATIGNLSDFVEEAFAILHGTSAYEKLPHRTNVEEKLEILKRVFVKNGRFDPEANGDDEVADKFAELEHESPFAAKQLKTATEIPEKLSPEAMGVKLVTSAGLDLPGDTREVWFSGKYLSIPSRYHEEFKQAVKELR